MDTSTQTGTKFKYGIIYLSYIPDGLNVKILRDILEQFGEVGRIYLEPEEKNRKKYVEGWVEFKKKRVAKEVAKALDGTPLQYGRKHSKLNGQIWSIKYLHRFKWANLTDQLIHVNATKDQRRRYELGEAKKQVDFYEKMTERSKLFQRKKQLGNKSLQSKSEELQRITKLKTRQNKPTSQGDELAVQVDEGLLSSIFKKVC